MSDIELGEEVDRVKRFQEEQFKSIGLKVIELEKKIETIVPQTPLAPATKNILTRQIDKLVKDVFFLTSQINELKRKLEMK